MPFDDDYKDLDDKNKGLKIDNKKSIFSSMPKKPNPAEFQKEVLESQDVISSYNEEAAELAILFKKSLEDKTLPQNKNSILEDIEKSLINKIANIAIKLNKDELEPEGIGSVGVSVLLLRSLLLQRDKINQLEFLLNESNKSFQKKVLEFEDKYNKLLESINQK